MELERLFWSHVTITVPARHRPELGPCWEWQGGRINGRVNTYGRVWDGTRQVGAHRRSWELTFGPIPDGLWVLHHCDRKLCVRPTHLFLGTHADNAADWSRKFRRFGGKPARLV